MVTHCLSSRLATKQILDGTLSEKGVIAPMNPKINNPLIKELAKYGYVLFLFSFRVLHSFGGYAMG